MTMPPDFRPPPTTGTGTVSSPPRLPVDAASYIRDLEAMKDHALRPGDALEIHLFALPETPTVYTVRADGAFFHPVIGDVIANGRTVTEVETDLKARFARELRNPSFRIGIYNLAPIQVTVIGEATRPGRVDISPGSTILDVMAAAGGVSQKGDDDSVIVIRGEEQMPVELDPPPAGEKAFAMKAGDIVYVYPGKTVNVTGEVQTPGVYAAGVEDTPLSMLMKAGGGKPSSALGRVLLKRPSLEDPVVLDLRPGLGKELPEVAKVLQEGDILQVDVQQAVVLAPGSAKMVPLDGDESLIDVLALNGVNEQANLSEIAVIRGDVIRAARLNQAASDAANEERLEKIEPEVYDVEKYFREGELTAHVPVRDGDLVFVPERGASFWEMLGFGGGGRGGRGGNGLLGTIFMFRGLFGLGGF